MPATLDLTGRVFGRLTAMRPERTRAGRYGWRCRCECGTEVVLPTQRLTRPRSPACRRCGQGAAGSKAASRNNRPVPATCIVCGAAFIGLGRPRYCSARCRNRASNVRRRGGPLVPGPRPCETCGAVIPAPKRVQRYCSPLCGQVGDAKVLAAARGTPEQRAATVAAELEARSVSHHDAP